MCESRWVGRPVGKHNGGPQYRGVVWNEGYYEVGCQVLLHSEQDELPYLARVECLWEDPKTHEPMVMCRWFYRRADVPAKLFDKPYKTFRGKNWTIRKTSGRATEASVCACV